METTNGRESGVETGLRAGRAAIALADPMPPGDVVAFAPTKAAKAGKNAAAVSLGRLGGLVGGKARAASLTAVRRAEIARKGGMTAAANRLARASEAKKKG